VYKRDWTRYTIVVCFLLSIGIFFTIWEAFSYHSELNKLEHLTHRLNARPLEESVQPNDHIGSRPVFIFMGKEVYWKDLAPNLESIYGKGVEKKVVGTFPVPHNFNGTDTSNITSDSERVYFPSYGEFYLHTTVGFFKILLLNPDASEDDRILSIASFVSGNSVHSMADARKIQPIYGHPSYTEDRLLKRLFASDQPLKLQCGHIALFLAFILSRQGYRVQLIQLRTEDQKKGHIVMQVFLPKMKKFIMIDPDYGAIVREKSANRILSIQEIAILVHDKPNSIRIEDIGKKHWLKATYDNAEPMPNFAWSPDKSGEAKAVSRKHYLQVMKDYTAFYWISDKSVDQHKWETSNGFRWDGELIFNCQTAR